MSVYWNCEHCGRTTPGIVLYQCNNPECRQMYCGVCHPRSMLCGCTYEESDGDDGYYEKEGYLSYLGKICSQEEWDEEKARLAEIKQRQEREEKERVERNERFEKARKAAGCYFKVTATNGTVYIGKVVESSFRYINSGNYRSSLSVWDFENIVNALRLNYKLPNPLHYGVRYKMGYIVIKGRGLSEMYCWLVDPGFFYRYYERHFNHWGEIVLETIDLKTKVKGRIRINVRDISSMEVYKLKMHELPGFE